MEHIESTVRDLLVSMGYKPTITRSEIAGQIVFSLSVGDGNRDLIGPRGETIQAIDHLVKKMLEKKQPRSTAADAKEDEADKRDSMFVIDVDEYRTRQIKDLQTKAKMMAERARSFQYDVELTPMTAYERLIIHTALQHEPNVKTESQGEGRNRRVVIKYSAQ